MAAVEARVDAPELRGSLIRQLIDGYLKEAHKGRVEGFDRQLAAQAGAALADPVVAQLVTPQAIIDLLDDGWPQGVVALAPGRAAGAGGRGPLRSDFELRRPGPAALHDVRDPRFPEGLYRPAPRPPPHERFRLLVRARRRHLATHRGGPAGVPAARPGRQVPRTPSAALH